MEKPSPRTAIAVVAGVTGIQVVATMSIMPPAAIAPKFAAALEFPVSWIGLQVSFAYVGAMAVSLVAGVCGRLFWGVVADRIRDGAITLILVAAVSVSAAWVTVHLVEGDALGVLYAVLFLFGFSAIGWNGVFMAEIARLAPPGSVGSATAGTLALTFFGVIMGPMVFSGILSFAGAYTTAFGFMSAITATGLVLVAMMRARSG